MKKFTKKLSAVVLGAMFASMQVSFAEINTGLGVGNGGAVINNATGGYVDMTTGVGKADLNFNGNSHVNWNTLNVNKGETLNFNAVNGATGITVLNTVNSGMSTIYGQINANNGIGKLIISNPNGMLFDGAKFTTAGDLLLTTQNMTNVKLTDLEKLSGAEFEKMYKDGMLIPVKIENSEFNVGGDYSIVAAGISAANSTISAKNVRLVTANGQDYLAISENAPTKDQTVTRLKAMNINGNLYITNEVGALEFNDGGTINGNVETITSGNVILNKAHNNQKLNVNGDMTVKGNGAQMFLRNAKVDGNLKMASGGGFLDVANVHVTKDALLKTVDVSTNQYNCQDVKHFLHVAGDTQVDGNLTIDAKDNIHIGGYDYDNKKLENGKLTVGGDLTAHTKDGHITTTIDTSANKITMKSDNLNILTDGKATMSAKEYDFSANGYIGGLNGDETYTTDEVIVAVMESYKHIPDTVKNPSSLNIVGGTIKNITTPGTAQIASKGDVKLTGANANKINITAPNKFIEITGKDVHANEINVGKETDKLKVDFPSRDYTLKYTNIRDAKEVVVNKTDEVTYELTNGENGYNVRDPRPANTTYLVGPDKPVTPPPTTPDIDDNENVKVLKGYERPTAVDALQPYTPVAYAADLDEDEINSAIRKNVDGSVTVVKAFPMVN